VAGITPDARFGSAPKRSPPRVGREDVVKPASPVLPRPALWSGHECAQTSRHNRGASRFGRHPRAAAAASTSVDIVASNRKFTPGAIQLHVGQVTALRVTSSDGVHGLQPDELGIPQATIAPGSVKTITITPKKAGSTCYTVRCSAVTATPT
jgi:heme/copper-type cytochrome/quinol oxidase subunit 2